GRCMRLPGRWASRSSARAASSRRRTRWSSSWPGRPRSASAPRCSTTRWCAARFCTGCWTTWSATGWPRSASWWARSRPERRRSNPAAAERLTATRTTEHEMKYLCLIYNEEDEVAAAQPELLEQVVAECRTYDARLREQGKLLASERLQPVATARS